MIQETRTSVITYETNNIDKTTLFSAFLYLLAANIKNIEPTTCKRVITTSLLNISQSVGHV